MKVQTLPSAPSSQAICRAHNSWFLHRGGAARPLSAGSERHHAARAALLTNRSSWRRCSSTSSSIRCDGSANGQAQQADQRVVDTKSVDVENKNKNRVASLFGKVLELPWERAVAWLIVGAFASQLKDFFGIIMGTFILSFIGNGFVKQAETSPVFAWLDSRKRRRFLVLLYFAAIISLVTLFGVMTIPDMVREGADFVERLQNDNIWVVVLKKMRQGVGDGVLDQVERFLLLASSDDIVHMASEVQMNTPEHTRLAGMALQKVLRRYTEGAVVLTSTLLSATTRFAVQVAVSLVLSFMLVWDLPTIGSGISSLKTSRVAFFYNEVAPTMLIFGQLFGKALGAQTRIAAANTMLTALGMWGLQIPGVAILSLFVFICGFIPIAGCFISTIPIGFVALTEYGFIKLSLVIAMVMVVHFIEAYGLNPAIYSAHLKLHPLLVLAVLVVAEHSLGIWGLLLAVPLTVFTIDYCLHFPKCSVTDVAARELQTVTKPPLPLQRSPSSSAIAQQINQKGIQPGPNPAEA